MRRAVIIGGGISGLSTAYYLGKAGLPATLVERSDRLGGVIQTGVVDGCVIEAGPDSFISIKPWALDLIRELGLGGDVIGSNDHLRVTYIWKGGRLLPLPDGLMMMVPTKILPMVATSLLSWPAKIRMGLEWFRKPNGKPLPDRSVADFIEDHYGTETVTYLAEPLLAGVYGGDPNRLSVNSVLSRFAELEARYGSLTRGVLAERRKMRKISPEGTLFRTLKGGLGQLTAALEHVVKPRLSVVRGEAEALERTVSGYRVKIGGDWIEAENVVLACQAYAAGALLPGLDAELAEALSGIAYSSSITVALGYDRRTFPHPLNGFGFLVPKKERRRLVACTWVGTKFPNRVPDGMTMLRCFLGGPGEDDVYAESDETLVAAIGEELRDMMGVEVKPVFSRISRWPRSMAQYTVGHASRVKFIEGRLQHLPGLHLAGNAYHGIGVPDCIRMGKEAAEAIYGARPESFA